ncbi:DUF896 domain-containing protein [Clostridium sp. cel8]|uniref:DUF896 domain-containing protein n=1 Tax=unclassified Clostridium TaxID=2614128 RepID=UPI0015F4BD62|nr:DUF896 domain-containing protein [Clostridium sp. cel8]MBA5851881.1 DUF896 domain-containing protein [Clostridium sp. cel8]
MNIDELVSRINFLYHKSKSEKLTEEEKLEQRELRKKYLQNIRANLKSQLDTIKKVNPSNERLN